MFHEYKIIRNLGWCTKLPEENSPIESPVFLVEGCECLFRFALEKDETTWIWYYSLYVELRRSHSKWEACNVSIQAGFKKEERFSLKKESLTVSEYGVQEIWFMEKELLRTKLPSDYVVGNWIIFRVSFEDVKEHLLEDKKEIGVQTPSYIDNNYLMEEISHDFSKLFEDSSNSDVIFTCGDQTIKAHKSVLCCRSAVFASMLQSDMVEGKTGQVNIQDMEPTIFKQFLTCLYTGSLPELTYDTAVGFYEAGDKYNVGALKKQCAGFLIDNLSPDNAYDILILADRHNDPDFKNKVLEYFIQEKLPYVGDRWTDFCNIYPKLSVEVLNLFCQHLRPKST